MICHSHRSRHGKDCLDGLSDETKQLFSNPKGRKQQTKTTTETDGDSNEPQQRVRIVLQFKKYLFQEKTVITQ